MELELWGTFSVRDHLVERAFVADVLLYDRLLIPTCPSAGSEADWPPEWRLERQRAVIDILGDTAIAIPWDQDHRTEWQRKFDAVRLEERRLARGDLVGGVNFDLGQVRQARLEDAPYKASRLVLADRVNDGADDRLYDRLRAFEKARPGSKLEAVAAYPDAASCRRDVEVGLAAPPRTVRAPSAMFSWDFFVPESGEQGEKADRKLLEAAVKLARSADFIAHRAKFYDWLADVSAGTIPADEAEADMERRISEYRSMMARRWPGGLVRRVVKIGAAFSGILGLAPGSAVLGAVAGSAFGMVDVFCDSKTPPTPLNLQPAAMFHEARDRLSRFA